MAIHVRVRRTRPRVYVSEDSLPEIRHRIETTHVEEWSQLVVWSRGIAKTPPTYRLRHERLAERGRRLAFMYAVRHGEKDLEFALEIAPRLVDAPTSPASVEALAQLYDALRAVLPEKRAVEMRNALLKTARELFEESIRGAPVLAVARSESVAAAFAAGLSLFGEIDEAQQLVAEAVHAARDLTGTLMYFLEEDGGFPLGWAESFVHLGQLPRLALLAESGLGQSWPSRAPWMEHYVEFLEAGLRTLGDGSRDGPLWAGGARATRRLDLWRVLVTVANFTGNAAARRLLRAVPLRGCQDERILYERREPGNEKPEDRGSEEEPNDGSRRPVARFYRRAGLALLRGRPDPGPELEVVIRCPVGALSGEDHAGAGCFSLAFGEDLIPGPPAALNDLTIGGAGDEEGQRSRSFPRTRREINQKANVRAEVLAFDAIEGVCEWMMTDVTGDYDEAESIIRTFVFLRDLPSWARPALVVYDEIRLRTPGGDAAAAVHLAVRPEVMENGVSVSVGERCLWDFVLLPAEPQLWLDEPIGAGAQSAGAPLWRLRIGSKESGALNRLCQVMLAAGAGEDARAECMLLPDTGATTMVIAGRCLVIADEDVLRLEAITPVEIKGIVAVGVTPSVKARLEVAGEDSVKAEASDSGSLYFERRIPPGTGFRISLQSDSQVKRGKRLSLRRRNARR